MDEAVGRAPRVLVVEDRPQTRYLLQVALGQEGMEVVVAGTVREALKALAAEPGAPDLVLLDLTLPDGSGERLARALRADVATRNVPVIVASCAPVGLLEMQAMDAQAVLPKPFDLTALIECVWDHLGRRRGNAPGASVQPGRGR